MPEISYEKFANAVLYLLQSCPGATGKVKLVKLLYFADFEHYERHAVPITGATYVALPMGPVPDNYEALFDRLANDGLVRKEFVALYGAANPLEAFIPLSTYNEDAFSPDEMETLSAIAGRLGRLPGNELIRRSHAEEPWRYVHAGNLGCNGNRIPYLLKTWTRDFPTPSDQMLAQQVIDSIGLAQ